MLLARGTRRKLEDDSRQHESAEGSSQGPLAFAHTACCRKMDEIQQHRDLARSQSDIEGVLLTDEQLLTAAGY